MKMTKGLIKADIIASQQAIDYYDNHNIKDIKNVAAYHLQQASEKLIKYQIYRNLSNTNNKQMYTHDLRKLKDYAESEGIKLVIPEYIKNHLDSITDWEAGSRYDTDFTVRIDTVKRVYEAVGDWIKRV